MIENNKTITRIVAAFAFFSISSLAIVLWRLAPPVDSSIVWSQQGWANEKQSSAGEAVQPPAGDADGSSAALVGDVYASSDDIDLNKAVREARAHQFQFESAFRSRQAGRYSFKIVLSDGLTSEAVWVRLTDIIDGDYQGEIGKIPQSLAFSSKDNTVRIPGSDIVDWMVQREDGIYGAYTTRILLRQSADPSAETILKRIRDF